MVERWTRWTRIFFVGFGFLAFGIGGLIAGLICLPLMNVFVREPEHRARMTRDFIGWSFRRLVGFLRCTRVLDYKVNGAEKLERSGLLILANHPTFLDIVFLTGLVNRADCIVKSGLWRNPFWRCLVTAANYIRNDEGEALLSDCVAAVRRGENLIIFPEGTRTPVGGALKLRRGAAHIAVRAGCNITPVLIECRPVMLARGIRWWKLPTSRSQFTITVKDDIEIESFRTSKRSEVLAARQLTDHLRDFFAKEHTIHAA